MSELQHLVESLQDTDAAAVHLSQATQENPSDEILRINAQAVAKRRDDLVRRLDDKLHASHGELVRYKMERDWTSSYPALAVAAAIASFQELVTAVFDAIHTAPKQRYRPAPDSVELSTFEFAGAAAGSVIISLSAMNERLLVGETELDKTLGLVERALSARTSDDLNQLAGLIGVSSITKAYAWADASSRYGLDTTIKWGRTYAETQEISISKFDAAVIKEIIANKSDESNIPETLVGILLGFDGATLYFHFETYDDKRDIKGKVEPSLSKSWTTGRPFRAAVIKTTKLIYATGVEEVGWTLVGLEPLPAP